MFTVAIVGRPNVGKSTLFNRLLKNKHSIVADLAGTTRDCIKGVVKFGNQSFKLIDTAGFMPSDDYSVDRTLFSLEDCDLILFVTADGITKKDQEFTSWLRKNSKNKEILVAKNKCDRKDAPDVSNLADLGQIFDISAEHNIGIRDLILYIASKMPKESEDDDRSTKPLRISILGRPNVGKSTLMNRLTNSQRSVVSDQSGTTRDIVEEKIRHRNIDIDLVDTAGMRKKSNVIDSIESSSTSKALQAAKQSDVVLFLFDAGNLALEKQDFVIISRALGYGKPVIIVANKSDTVANVSDVINFALCQSNKFLLNEVNIFAISSLNDNDFTDILDECERLAAFARKTFKTGELNKWLTKVTNQHKHPMVNSKTIRLKYISQVPRKSLTFDIFCNHPDLVMGSYVRHLKNSFCQAFGLKGVPIRMNLKKSRNPYAN